MLRVYDYYYRIILESWHPGNVNIGKRRLTSTLYYNVLIKYILNTRISKIEFYSILERGARFSGKMFSILIHYVEYT